MDIVVLPNNEIWAFFTSGLQICQESVFLTLYGVSPITIALFFVLGGVVRFYFWLICWVGLLAFASVNGERGYHF